MMSSARRRDVRNLPEAPRQADEEDEKAGLLVFGYHCKLFRDDDKAMFIEQKKHLIPWMGDSSLMIDRSADHAAISKKVSISKRSILLITIHSTQSKPTTDNDWS